MLRGKGKIHLLCEFALTAINAIIKHAVFCLHHLLLPLLSIFIWYGSAVTQKTAHISLPCKIKYSREGIQKSDYMISFIEQLHFSFMSAYSCTVKNVLVRALAIHWE